MGALSVIRPVVVEHAAHVALGVLDLDDDGVDDDRPHAAAHLVHLAVGADDAKGVDIEGMVAELMGKPSGLCKGKGGSMHIAYGSMHIADVDKGVLGANGSGVAGISNSATTGAVTDNVSKAIASLGMAWSGKNVRIGQAGVGTQVTDSFAKLVAIGLVYLILVILFASLLGPLVIFSPRPLSIIIPRRLRRITHKQGEKNCERSSAAAPSIWASGARRE
jgi:hypothetical protein